MNKTLIMTPETIQAQIDVCGKMVAYCAENAGGVVSDGVMWDLNQATIALEHAYRNVGKEDE